MTIPNRHRDANKGLSPKKHMASETVRPERETTLKCTAPLGAPLSSSDYATLNASWITREIADAAMLRRVDDQLGRELVGQKGSRDCAGLIIPYYWPGDPSPFNYRLRRDQPDLTAGTDGKVKQERKYLGPPKSGNRLYIPPGVKLDQLADPTIPIALVEGEKKALALWRLGNHEVDQPRFIPVGIAGVWNWRGVIGKTGGPKGERLDLKGPIADLSRVAWQDRKTFIAFDANVKTNESVKLARNGIARNLVTRGATVQLVNLPEEAAVNGIDDLLAIWGPERVLKLFESAVPGAELAVILPPQYDSRAEGMFRMSGRDQLSQVQLTNYQSKVVTNILLDDGLETKRELEIDSQLLGRQYRFCVSASDFASMDWVIGRMGSAAITFPNQKDHARAAIQSRSLEAEEKFIYTHTGWRRIGSQWLFLHEGGAISGNGSATTVNMRLSGSMSKYLLPAPPSCDQLKLAVLGSLRLVDLGPPQIGFSLLAATFRAILGEADFAVHLAGETGAFKSEVAALFQQHFGVAMNRLSLPASWSSTANALEALAFHAKDALLVIDDFAPQGNGADVARYHTAAERVFRGVGNQAGRSRLDSSANLRQTKAPRALVLSTGEEIPRGQSVRARLWILELAKDEVASEDLARYQADAADGLFAAAMAGFIEWIAGQYDDRCTEFEQRRSELRVKARNNAGHARTPEIMANLQAALELYLNFAVAAEAITESQRSELSNRCWEALDQVAQAQGKHQSATEPTATFLAVIRSLLTSGIAHLEGRTGEEPQHLPNACGWRREGDNWRRQGSCIGWADGEDVYLEPIAAYRAVQKALRDAGEGFPVSEATLRKRLREKGLLASVDAPRQTLTVRRQLAGSSKSVLHFLRSTILPDTSDADEDAR